MSKHSNAAEAAAFYGLGVWISLEPSSGSGEGGLEKGPSRANLAVPIFDELVAQSVEHRPFKAVVPGSSPGQLTIHQPCPSSMRLSWRE